MVVVDEGGGYLGVGAGGCVLFSIFGLPLPPEIAKDSISERNFRPMY